MNLSAESNSRELQFSAKAARLVLSLANLIIHRPILWRLRASFTCRRLRVLSTKSKSAARTVERVQQDLLRQLRTALVPELIHYGVIGAAVDLIKAGASPALISLSIPAVTLKELEATPASPQISQLTEALLESRAADDPLSLTELTAATSYLRKLAELRLPGKTAHPWQLKRIKGISRAIPTTPDGYQRLAGVFVALLKSNRFHEARELFRSTEKDQKKAALLAESIEQSLLRAEDTSVVFNCQTEREIEAWKALFLELPKARSGVLERVLVTKTNELVAGQGEPSSIESPLRIFTAAVTDPSISMHSLDMITVGCAYVIMRSWSLGVDGKDGTSSTYKLAIQTVAKIIDRVPDQTLWAASAIARRHVDGRHLHARIMEKLRRSCDFPDLLVEVALIHQELRHSRFDRLSSVLEPLHGLSIRTELAQKALKEISHSLFLHKGSKLNSHESEQVAYAIDLLVQLGADVGAIGSSGSAIFAELLHAADKDSAKVRFFEKSTVYSWLRRRVLGSRPSELENLAFSLVVKELYSAGESIKFKQSTDQLLTSTRLLTDLLCVAGSGMPLLMQLPRLTGQVLRGDSNALLEALALTEIYQFKGEIRVGSHINEPEFLVLFAAALQKGNQELADILSMLITAIHQWSRHQIPEISTTLARSYSHCGVLAHSFRRWRFLFTGPDGASIAEQYGFTRKQTIQMRYFELNALGRINTKSRTALGEAHTLSEESEIGFARGYLIARRPNGCLIIKNASKTFGRDLLTHTCYFSASFSGTLNDVASNYNEAWLKAHGFVSITQAPIYISDLGPEKAITFQALLTPLVRDIELVCCGLDAWLFDTDRETAWLEDPFDNNSVILTGAHHSRGFEKLLAYVLAENNRGRSLRMGFFNSTLPPFALHSTVDEYGNSIESLVLDRETIHDLYALAENRQLPPENVVVRFINDAGLMSQGTLFIFDANDL